jgi:hypothetical protein
MIDQDEWGYGAHVLNLARDDDRERAFVVSSHDVLGDGLETILVRATVEPDVPDERRGVWVRLRARLGSEVEVVLNRADARWLAEAIAEELARLDEAGPDRPQEFA